MELTWLGVVLIPMGLLTAFVAPNRLKYLAVFFIPFTASSVLNSASGVPLSPFQLFGALFIFYRILAILNARRGRLSLGGDRSIALLLIFMTVTVVSMIMPAIIDGRLVISSNRLNDLYNVPLRLTESNIKYPLPVILGVLFATFLAFAMDSPDKIRSLIKVYVFSGIVVALWGIFQFLCANVLHIEYPGYLFNNVKLDTVQGFGQQLNVNGEVIGRISSVAHEPSIFAKYLLTVSPIVIASVWLDAPLFGTRSDKVILGLFFVVVSLTTSTMGYVGIIAALLICALIIGRYRTVKFKLFGWILMVGGVIVSVLTMFPFAGNLLSFATISKIDSGSAIERTFSIMNSWKYFLEYPILGVGWAMVTSHDLIVNLLVNTGIIGLLTFSMLVFYLVKRSIESLDLFKRVFGRWSNPLNATCLGLLVSLIVLIFNGILSGLEFYLGYFYFVVGMLAAANTVMRQKIGIAKQMKNGVAITIGVPK